MDIPCSAAAPRWGSACTSRSRAGGTPLPCLDAPPAEAMGADGDRRSFWDGELLHLEHLGSQVGEDVEHQVGVDSVEHGLVGALAEVLVLHAAHLRARGEVLDADQRQLCELDVPAHLAEAALGVAVE